MGGVGEGGRVLLGVCVEWGRGESRGSKISYDSLTYTLKHAGLVAMNIIEQEVPESDTIKSEMKPSVYYNVY